MTEKVSAFITILNKVKLLVCLSMTYHLSISMEKNMSTIPTNVKKCSFISIYICWADNVEWYIEKIKSSSRLWKAMPAPNKNYPEPIKNIVIYKKSLREISETLKLWKQP